MKSILFKIKPSKKKSSATIRLEGELTIKNASELKIKLQEAVEQYSSISILVANVTAMDLTGVQLLWSTKHFLEGAGKKLEVKFTVSEEVKELLLKGGFQSMLKDGGL